MVEGVPVDPPDHGAGALALHGRRTGAVVEQRELPEALASESPYGLRSVSPRRGYPGRGLGTSTSRVSDFCYEWAQFSMVLLLSTFFLTESDLGDVGIIVHLRHRPFYGLGITHPTPHARR